MARPQLSNISWSDVYDIKTRFMNEYPEFYEARKTDRIPLGDQFNLFARFCDMIALAVKNKGGDPVDYLIRLFESRPQWLFQQMRTPGEEFSKLFGAVPIQEDTPEKGDHKGGSEGQGEGKGSGDGQGDGQGQDGDGQGDKDGDQGDGDGQGDGKGSGDSKGDKDGDQGDGDGQGDGQKDQGDGDQKVKESRWGQGEYEPGYDDEDQDGDDQEKDDDSPAPDSFEAKVLKAMDVQFIKGERSTINLVGDAGLGKTYTVRKCAARRNAKIFVQTAVDTTAELMGTTGLEEVNGASVTVYKPSNLVKGLIYANEHPDERVVILADEYDVLPNDVKTKLNSLLAPPYVLNVKGGTIDEIYMPLNCVFVAISNTAGHGGNDMYPDRQLVDISTMDRFEFNIRATFDEGVALKIAKNDVNLVKFLLDWNKSVIDAAQPRFVASYRTIEHAQKNLLAGFSKEEFMPVLTRMGTESEVRQFYEGLEDKRNGWAMALHKYVDSLPKGADF